MQEIGIDIIIIILLYVVFCQHVCKCPTFIHDALRDLKGIPWYWTYRHL